MVMETRVSNTGTVFSLLFFLPPAETRAQLFESVFKFLTGLNMSVRSCDVVKELQCCVVGLMLLYEMYEAVYLPVIN
jgi:hypothetical protein